MKNKLLLFLLFFSFLGNKVVRNVQSFISNYTINHGHSINIFAIDYVRTNRMNNLEKLGV